MPEVPELENVRRQLEERVVGRRIVRASPHSKGGPIVLRDLSGLGPKEALKDRTIADVRRRGKFLIFDFVPPGLQLVINPKLAGRLLLTPSQTARTKSVLFSLELEDPSEELRYVDAKQMGQIYLTPKLAAVPTFDKMGPEALGVDRQTFTRRLRSYRGEIKGILARERFLAGIGNAYADEILWQARIHPYRKRPSLAAEEIARLFEATRMTLLEAGHLAREQMGEAIDKKPRDFHLVHLRGGQPCARCGTSISEIRARRRITNFCRNCQPGGLVTGMGAPASRSLE